jgi:site-specific recombinase XerD
MAIEYREERNQKFEKQIEKLIADAPSYVKEFYNHMHSGKREIATQVSYIRDVINFLKYEKSHLSEFENVELKDIPISLFDSLQIQDLNEYRDYMRKSQKLSNASIKKHFASLASFYNFLNMMQYTQNRPTQFFEVPPVNKKKIIKLDSELSNKLLNGVLANDRYLIDVEDGEDRIVEILEPIKIKRERLVLRNYAIICLFLGSGLRVSELVGLDLEDINFRQNSITVIAKGGDETQVYFGEEVAKALKEYINGLPLPSELAEKYKYSNSEAFEWCKGHMSDEEFIKHLDEKFPECDESFRRDMIKLRYSMLRQGRSALKPQKGNNAVFITTRGTRMSVRSVELMIKEMVKTYLPEYDDKDKFSPHKLRATCATRILTQTGDIQLASTQLNHKGIAVTAAFYAELQKEQQKEKIKNLDMNKW